MIVGLMIAAIIVVGIVVAIVYNPPVSTSAQDIPSTDKSPKVNIRPTGYRPQTPCSYGGIEDCCSRCKHASRILDRENDIWGCSLYNIKVRGNYTCDKCVDWVNEDFVQYARGYSKTDQ